MSTRSQAYIQSLLQNPEWIKSLAAKHNRVQTTDQGQIVCLVSPQQIVDAVYELETAFLVEDKKRN